MSQLQRLPLHWVARVGDLNDYPLPGDLVMRYPNGNGMSHDFFGLCLSRFQGEYGAMVLVLWSHHGYPEIRTSP
jgi:hypothetical protein